MNKKYLLLVSLALVLVAAFYILRPNKNISSNPSFAPEFSLTDLNGQQLRLSSYKGKVVLLDFWATWCVPCRAEIPEFIALKNKYGAQGFEVIGISMDDGPDPVRAFYKELKMNYPVVMGDAKTGELYGGILGLPVCFIIDRNGRIVRKHVGPVDARVLEEEIQPLLQAR